MTRFALLLRNLRHFRGANLAVIAGMAVATAVLLGALMVGDSVRGSLRDLAVQRLGKVDHAMMASRFVPETLATRMADSPRFKEHFTDCEGGILLRGGAATDEPRHNTRVQIGALPGLIPVDRGQCIVNGATAEALDLPERSTTIRLALPMADAQPRDSAFARRGRQETIARPPLATTRRAAAGFESLFNPMGGQRVPRNLWMNLQQLQQEIDQSRKVNTLLVSAKAGDAKKLNATLGEILHDVATLEDYGLAMATSGKSPEAVLTSSSTYISGGVDDAVKRACEAMNVRPRRVLTYMANTVALAGGDKEIHYAVASGVSDLPQGELGASDCAINQWTADRLDAKVGDRIRLDYYQRSTTGDLVEVRSDAPGVGLVFTIKYILPMEGVGADNSFTPNYRGLTNAKTVREWDPPEGLVIHKRLVTDADEKYWEQYRAAPKVFISLDAACKLWGTTFGSLTSIRVPQDRAEAFTKELLKQIDPAAMGLVFTPIRADQLASATGGTDFGPLFIGFSFFIIVAAAMLLAMLMRLSIEQRARQWGLLASLGFAPKSLRRLALGEGMVLALVGAIIGAALAVAYTAGIMYGLRTWWVGAVGTTALRLHVEGETIAIGLASSLILALLAIWWAIRRVGRTSPATLLAGGWGAQQSRRKRGRIAPIVAVVGALGGLALIGIGATGKLSAQIAFMAGGFLLLSGALAFIATRLRAPARGAMHLLGAMALERVGMRNSARHPGRSLLAVSLIAFATFILITVASMHQDAPQDTHDKSSGAGGFRVMLDADIPLLGNLATPEGRKLLAVKGPDDPERRKAFQSALKDSKFVSLRSWAGQDISCLNLTRPTQPTILAAPKALFEGGRFTEGKEDYWKLLTDKLPDDQVPVLADAETAEYILKLSVGDTLTINDQNGRERKLRLVGVLHHSIFQSQLLMAEENFVRLFPFQSGYGMVLIDASAQDAATLLADLPNELDDYAVNVERTADRLASYFQVANTYLDTFQTLGALGLLLGTIGLSVVLLRSLVERRPELALLSALGFRTNDRLRLVLSENALLLVLGLVVGALCAAVAVSPAVFTGRSFNLGGLGLSLGAILVVGLATLAITVGLGARHLRPGDLRAE